MNDNKFMTHDTVSKKIVLLGYQEYIKIEGTSNLHTI